MSIGTTVRFGMIFGAALAASGSALGGFLELEAPVTLDRAGDVRVELIGAWAAAAGDVYFAGSQIDGAFTAAADTGLAGLGTRLFHSKDAAGSRVDLGWHDAGATLHFGYHVTKGYRDLVELGDVMRSDVSDDFNQFGFDADHTEVGVRWRLGMEDIRAPKRSDWDYQDAVFDVIVTPRGEVPTPGAATLLGVSGLLAARRRRR